MRLPPGTSMGQTLLSGDCQFAIDRRGLSWQERVQAYGCWTAVGGAAGSLATMMLADFGADVIRLEPPVEGTEATPADLLLQPG